MKFTIPGRLAGMNEYVAKNRKSPYAGAALKRKDQNTVLKSLMGCKEVFTEPVYLRFNWVEPNKRRDKDNIAAGGRKAVLDALTTKGILQNDGWKQILGFSDRFDVDKDNPRIEVEVITESEMKKRQENFVKELKED